MHELEHTLLDILEKQGMSLSDLAQRAEYTTTFFREVVSGKSRQTPVDFFVRIANALDIKNEEKDALVRSWAFGVERWRG
jgi:predicted transcriptional regulator